MAAGIVALTARIGGVGTVVSGLGQIDQSLLRTSLAAQGMAGTLNAVTGNFQNFQAATGAINQSLQAIGSVAGAITTPIAAVGSALGKVVEVAGTASSAIVSSLGEIAAAGAGLGTAGALGVGAFGTALAGGLGASIGLAAKFHQELTDIGAISQASAADVSLVEEAIKRMASQFAIAIPDIQRTALELIKSGVSAKDVANGVLRVSLSFQQLSKGELDAQKSGEGLGSLLQLFDRQFKESGQSIEAFSERIAKAVATTANSTRASYSEVINGANKLAPTLAARGSDLESVFASLNVVLARGIRGEEAGTGLRNLFNFVINPSKEALATIKELGLEDISPFDIDQNFRPALDILRSIQKVFGDESGLSEAQREQAAGKLFQTRAATLAALIRLAGPEGIEEFFKKLADADPLQQASDQLNTLTRQLGLLKNAAELAAIAFGQNFLDALTDTGKQINAFLSEGGATGRASAAGGAAGAGLLSLLTGEGQDESFAGITQQFGEGAGDAFALIFNQVDALRQPIAALLGDIQTLGSTFLNLVFPEGPAGAIAALGVGFTEAVALADRFVNFLTQNLPATVGNIQSLVTEAGKFKEELTSILGLDGDQLLAIWKDLQPLIGTVRDTLRNVTEETAGFVKVLLDNRGPILGFLRAVVSLLGAVDTIILRLAGIVPRAFAGFGELGAIIGGGFGRAIQGPRGNFQTVTAAERARQGQAVQFPGGRDTDLRGQGQARTTFGPLESELETIGPLLNEVATGFGPLISEMNTVAKSGEAFAKLGEDVDKAGNSLGVLPVDAVAAARAAGTLQDAVTRANERIAEAIEDAERTQRAAFRQLERSLESIEQRYKDTLESIAEAMEDSTEQITRSAQEQKEALDEAFDIRNREQEIREQFGRIQQANRTTFDRAQQDEQARRARAIEEELQAFSRGNEDQLRVFQQGQDAISRARQAGIDRENTTFQRGQEDKLRIATRGQEEIQRALSRRFEEQNLGVSRGREDSERERQFAKDLSKAKTAEERIGIQERFKEETENLVRRRGFEDTDLQTRRSQEQQTLELRRSQESELLKLRQSQEDEGFNRRLEQAEREVVFRIRQERLFIEAQRIIQDAERDRRRILDASELIARRQDENDANEFQTGQQREQKGLELQLAQENLDRQKATIDKNAQTKLNELLQQNLRHIATLQRTTDREKDASLRDYNDKLLTTRERLGDIGTDLPRSLRAPQQALLAIDPNLENAKSAAAIAAAQGIGGTLAGAQGVLGATTIVAQQQGLAMADAFTSRLKSVVEGQGNAITITTVLNSPQAERLAVAMEQLVEKIDKVKPGVQINELNQTIQPGQVFPAFQGSGTLGGF